MQERKACASIIVPGGKVTTADAAQMPVQFAHIETGVGSTVGVNVEGIAVGVIVVGK